MQRGGQGPDFPRCLAAVFCDLPFLPITRNLQQQRCDHPTDREGEIPGVQAHRSFSFLFKVRLQDMGGSFRLVWCLQLDYRPVVRFNQTK